MSRKEFYHSKAWKNVRKTVWINQYCLCKRCNRAVYVDGISDYIPVDKRLRGIVHHIEYLNNTNYTDDNISLNIDNLEGLCIDCHNKEHFHIDSLKNSYRFDEEGNLIPSPIGKQ